MTETFTDSGALVAWSTPQCPFAIEYSRKALDDIRLAVVDAFFSLPRGGAEIGGILLGRFDDNRLQVLDHEPLESEHAFGPTFMLSSKDQAALVEMLAQAQHRSDGLRPVGWYHSHTRSDVSLCEADLEIHNRYFSERWHVALVLRPSTVQATQAGFFFREPDGSIHSSSSYQQFELEALPVMPLPSGLAEAMPGPIRETGPGAVVITLPVREHAEAEHAEAQPEPPSAEAHAHAAEEPPVAPPEPASEPVVETHTEPVAEAHWEPPAVPFVAPVAEHTFTEQAHPEEAVHAEPEREFAPRRFERAPELPGPEAGTSEPEDTRELFAKAAETRPRRSRTSIGVAAGVVAGLLLGMLADQARSRYTQPPPPPRMPVTASVGPLDVALRKQNTDLAQENAGLRKQNADLTQQQADWTKQRADLQQERDDLSKQTAKLKADLGAQTARSQSLQQQLEDLRRQQQRRRLSVQSTDPLP